MKLRSGGRNCPGSRSTRNIDSKPMKGAPHWRTSSEGGRSCSYITSCSGPDYKAGCPSCSAIADGFNGIYIHLANHDVMFWAISRAPLAQLNEYKKRMGWTFPWASSFGSDFNFDFDASFTEEQQREGIEYNYQREEPAAEIPSRSTPDGPTLFAAMSGTDVNTYTRERP